MLTISWLYYFFLILLFLSLLITQLKILSSLNLTLIMHFPRKPGEVYLYMLMASKPSFIINHATQTPFISNRVIHSISQNPVFPLCPLFCYCLYSLFLSFIKLCPYLSPRPGSRFISFKKISQSIVSSKMKCSLYFTSS